MGIQAVTDASGQVTFTLPDKAYKIRADYPSLNFWSDPFTGGDQSIINQVIEIP